MDEDLYFNLYKDKALDALSQRAIFIGIFAPAIIVSGLLNGNFIDEIVNYVSKCELINGLPYYQQASIIFFYFVIFICMFSVFSFYELKYREYRRNYIYIGVRKVIDQLTKENPDLYNRDDGVYDLAKEIEKITQFSLKHIYPIINELSETGLEYSEEEKKMIWSNP